MVLQGPEVPWAPASAFAPTGGRLSTVTVRHTVRPAIHTTLGWVATCQENTLEWN